MPARGKYESAGAGWCCRGSIPTACAHCAAPMRTFPSRAVQKRHFCSTKCYRATLAGPGNPKWRGVSLPRICPHCGATFSVEFAGNSHQPGKFCSAKCARAATKKYATTQEKRRAATRRREIRERTADNHGGHHTEEEWAALLKRHGGRCAYCGSSERIVRDHIRPLSKGGTDLIENIQPLCRPCNGRKYDKWPYSPSI